ncbi:MAG: hypothetical protein Q4G58_04965 [bacterium]|nr:hypothetical protein [bacterium]
MFSEARGQLNNSKSTFSEKANDSFGNSIVKEVYKPFESDLQMMDIVWDEAEARKMEIMAILLELRTIL